MADGKVEIRVIADEKQALELLKTMKSIENQANSMNVKLSRTKSQKPFTSLAENVNQADKSVRSLFKAILGSTAVVTSLNLIKDSVGQAISRFDTMKQFPRMMQNLGFSSEASERAIRKLALGIEGLPTRLDEVVATTQQITNITDDLNYATDLTLALNNAFLSSGSSASDASRGLIQYTQMLSSGKVDMQSWRTLQETMGVGLKKVAKEFGFLGTSAVPKLYESLRSGDITFRDFSMKLIEMDKAVGGFAETAAIGSQGIATSWQNVKTAVVNGITSIIEVFDENSKKMTGAGIAAGLDILKITVKGFFSAVKSAIRFVLPAINLLIATVVFLIKNFENLKPLIIGITVALGALFLAFNKGAIILAMTKLWTSLGLVIGGVGTAFKSLWAIMLANPIVAVVGVVAGVITAIGVALSRTTDKQKQFIKNSEKVSQAVQNLSDNVKTNAEKWESNKEYLEANKKSMESLIDKTDELSNSQNRGSAGTKELKDNVSELNKYFGEQIVLYDEKTKSVNISAEAMKAYLEVASEEKNLIAIKEEIARLDKEKVEIDIQKKANAELLAQAEKELNEANWFQKGKINEKIKELTESQTKLTDAEKVNNEQFLAANELKNESLAKASEAEQNLSKSIENRMITMSELDDKEREIVEAMQSRYKTISEEATNMFDKINEKSKISKEEMLDNLESNIEAVERWADNLASLSDRGINEGMLEKLRKMGPEGAGYVAELSRMSDKELQQFNHLFEKAGTVSKDGLIKSMGVGKDEIPKAINDLATTTESSLSKDFKAKDWSAYGKSITDGLKNGVDKGKKEVESATKDVATKQMQIFMSELGIHSPSTVFMQFGQNITDGLKNGIEQGKASVTNAMKNIAEILNRDSKLSFDNLTKNSEQTFKKYSNLIRENINISNKLAKNGLQLLVQEFSSNLSNVIRKTKNYMDNLKNVMNISNQTRQAGINAGLGFMNGLEYERLNIISTAESIANEVAYTIRNALDIHSPSRILKKIGMQAGQGFEIGLDSKIDSVKQKSKILAESSIPKIDKSKLFITGLDFAKENTVITNNDKKNTVNNNFEVKQIVWNNKEDIRKTMEEIGWITGQERLRLEYS